MKYIASITSLAFCVVLAVGAEARPVEHDVSVEVSYADLDLSTQAGRNTLESRITGAIRRVCWAADLRDLRAGSFQQICRAKAWKGVDQQLAAIYGNQRVAQAAVQISGTQK